MKTKIGIAALVAVAIAGTATAVMPIGEPDEGDSWSQQFYEVAGGGAGFAPGPFDTIVIQMTSEGDSFESPAIYGFSGSSNWQMTYVNDADHPTYVVAKGDVVTIGQSLYFWVRFAGSSSESLQLQYAAFLGNDLVLHREMDWNPGWGIHDGDPDMVPILIPLPAPVLLAAAGLGGVFVLRRKKTG